MKIYLLKDIFSLYFLLLNCGKYKKFKYLLKNRRIKRTIIIIKMFNDKEFSEEDSEKERERKNFQKEKERERENDEPRLQIEVLVFIIVRTFSIEMSLE